MEGDSRIANAHSPVFSQDHATSRRGVGRGGGGGGGGGWGVGGGGVGGVRGGGAFIWNRNLGLGVGQRARNIKENRILRRRKTQTQPETG